MADHDGDLVDHDDAILAITMAGMRNWLEWVRDSANAFMTSIGKEQPSTWGEMSVFIEQFLKPWALAHLARADGAKSIDDVSVGQIADRLKADRGTVNKQLRRYFESRKDV